MFTPTIEQLASFFGLCGVGMAAWERYQASKQQKKIQTDQAVLSAAQSAQDQCALLLVQVENYKTMLLDEQEQHKKTRQFHHDQAGKAQELLAKCNETCQELKSKTDLSKLEEILIRQLNISTQMGDGITELLKRITK